MTSARRFPVHSSDEKPAACAPRKMIFTSVFRCLLESFGDRPGGGLPRLCHKLSGRCCRRRYRSSRDVFRHRSNHRLAVLSLDYLFACWCRGRGEGEGNYGHGGRLSFLAIVGRRFRTALIVNLIYRRSFASGLERMKSLLTVLPDKGGCPKIWGYFVKKRARNRRLSPISYASQVGG
jgi:hypothetical protein